jgi:hypothetical protein
MSVASYGFENVGVNPDKYINPRIKVNKRGQITYIDNLGIPEDPNELQEKYDALLATYTEELNEYNNINNGIIQYSQILEDDIVTPLNQEKIELTNASTDLTTAINSYTPFNYSQITVLSNQLVNIEGGYKFSNIADKPDQQQLQTIFSLSVPAGNYLVQMYLCCEATAGEVNKIPNSGSTMTLVLSDSGNPQLFYTLIQTGTASVVGEDPNFTRQQASGQQYVSFTSATNVDFRFCISQGAAVGQASFQEFGVSYSIQRFATIGSGENFNAGIFSPTQVYKCLSFIKI